MYELAYVLLLIIVLSAIGAALRKACMRAGMERVATNRFTITYILLMTAWVAYVTLVSHTGFFQVFSFPPRILLFIVLPAFALIAWFFGSGRFQAVIENFSLPFTVYFQSFRIGVELLILGIYLKGLAPYIATFEGYNFDILAGLTAPLIGWLAFQKRMVSRRALIAWNIACLLLLANIVIIFNTLILKPGLWGYAASPVSPSFAVAPYIFIAAVYMPAAVFMHVCSLKKLVSAKHRQVKDIPPAL